MGSKIIDNLQGKTENYIFPFFWQHGEDEATLREYMKAIDEASIKAVCVESRPHPDFAGPKWWEDMDVILDEAKKRNMKVWILDDAHFPTGMANGKMDNADPSLCKQYLNYNYFDVPGPMPQVNVDINAAARYTPSLQELMSANSIFAGNKERRVFDDDKLFAVVASRLDGQLNCDLSHVDDSLINLTGEVKDGMLFWDVPAGTWRIYVIYLTHNGGGAQGYINMVDAVSCRVLIDEVYEPHYAHYKDEFGKTIAGFFSDEPCFGNVVGFDWDNIIGQKQMALPWGDTVVSLLREKLGADYMNKLPALWGDVGSKELTAEIRVAYMDTITELMQKAFGEQLGEWCRERGVEYIGHIVEDNNASEKLGSSMGHFFRALWGQDMSGIDDIGGQVMLGGENIIHKGLVGGGDGEFYHNALAKLGSSLGHIDPKKHGRTMCEAFGAYGWDEGTRQMKYITDHLLVRGVNRFVPHAFSAKAFPDPDCPPHFYAGGENPLYRPFGELMKYTNRMCHLFDGGLHIASVALLYHAEAEWSGGEYMLMQKPARVMAEGQIDFDIIPCDVFRDMDMFNAAFDKNLVISGETFEALVIPGCEYLPKETVEFINMASQKGFPVVFVGSAPAGCDGAKVVELTELADYLRSIAVYDISIDTKSPMLRYYHYLADSEHRYMFSNEDTGEACFTTVTLKSAGKPYCYDGTLNALYKIPYEQTESGLKIKLELLPLTSTVIIVSANEEYEAIAGSMPAAGEHEAVIGNEWKISITENKSYPEFGESYTSLELGDINRKFPTFSGIIRYETTFDSDILSDISGNIQLKADYVYEAMEVWCNGEYAGMAIAAPYTIDLTGLVKAGENALRIEVATTLQRKVETIPVEGPMAMFSRPAIPKTPSGIIGKVKLYS